MIWSVRPFFNKRRQSFYDNGVSLHHPIKCLAFLRNQFDAIACYLVSAFQFRSACFHVGDGESPIRLKLKCILPTDITPGDVFTAGGQAEKDRNTYDGHLWSFQNSFEIKFRRPWRA